MRKRNLVSNCLLAIGCGIIAVGFIAGIALSWEMGRFHFVIALYWWLSAIVSGFVFIGLSEIIHLLQNIYDRLNCSALPQPGHHSSFENGAVRANNLDDSPNEPVTPDSESSHNTPVKFNGLTVRLDQEKMKAEFWITADSLHIMKRSVFQPEFDAKLIKKIRKTDINRNFEKEKDYLIFTFHDPGTRTWHRLAFKTYTIHDYERIVTLLQNVKP
ncbi:hypothetical protein [Paenibacillus protaetiae]|nr:hypothetical protein [Paenibacillus protaetiae]